MKDLSIKKESPDVNGVNIKEELGFDLDEPSSFNSIADIPQHIPAMSACNTAVSSSYDPSGAKPTSKRRSNSAQAELQRIWTAREATRRRHRMEHWHKDRTANKRLNMKQNEGTQQIQNPNAILGGMERMQIALPPITKYAPSSSLTLAPLRFPSSPDTTEPTKQSSAIVSGKSTTTDKPSFDIGDLIGKAILSAPDHRMTSLQIADWITENHPHSGRTGKQLKKYISGRLARKDTCFNAVGKKGYCYVWTVVPEMRGRFV